MDNFTCLEGLNDWDYLLMTCKGKNMIIKVSDNIKYDKINYYVAKSSLYLNNFLLNLKLVFLK